MSWAPDWANKVNAADCWVGFRTFGRCRGRVAVLPVFAVLAELAVLRGPGGRARATPLARAFFLNFRF
jgi:hypothetical protein